MIDKRGAREVLSTRQRLQKRREYQKVQNSGKKRHCAHFLVIRHPNPFGIKRLGITVSKRAGGAVKRNRIRRIVREVFRLHYTQFPDSTDIVCVAKMGAHTLKMQDAAQEILSCFMTNQPRKKIYSLGH